METEKRENGGVYLLHSSSTQCIESHRNPTAHLVVGCYPKKWMSTKVTKAGFGNQECSGMPEASLPSLCIGQ